MKRMKLPLIYISGFFIAWLIYAKIANPYKFGILKKGYKQRNIQHTQCNEVVFFNIHILLT